MEGSISDIKRMSVHDGPGIRTTLFMKGCPLRCLWCHNPENLRMEPALSFTQKLCVGCGACADVCPHGVHHLAEGKHTLQYDSCRLCGACVDACLPGALKIYGKKAAPKEVAELLLEDTVFYMESGGGVTFSGGEPLLQSKFLAETMKLLKQHGIHIAVDTCGEVPWSAFTDVLPYTDLFLFDIKHLDSEAHRRGTGRGNERILVNLERLGKEGSAVEIRTPVIPGYNDNMEHLQSIAQLLRQHPTVRTWRLLPYHSMAKGKYEALGMEYPMPETEMPDAKWMRELQENLSQIFIGTKLSSDE